jgi:hypothetical protein
MTATLAPTNTKTVISATHHGANARTVTGKAIVAVHRYKITAVLFVELPALSNRW